MRSRLVALLARVGFAWARRQLDEDTRQEIDTHLDLLARRYQDAGVPASEARAAAARQFGNVTTTREDIHAMNGFPRLESLWQDVRYGIRTLGARPGFAAVTILSLALGIGANTAIFSVISSVLMSPLPVREPQELVTLTDPAASGVSQGSERNERSLLTYTEFLQLRDHLMVFSSLMASQSQLELVSARVDGGGPEEVRTEMVSAEYFRTLEVPALLGRTFGADDDPTASYAVISDAYWQRRFARRADIIGTTIAIRQGVFSVIGVTPPSFFGVTVGQRPDVWLPLTMQPAVLPGRDWLHDTPGSVEKVMWLHAIGRLKPGITLEKAQAAANVVFQQGLTAYYGAVLTQEARQQFLNQRLKLHPATTGVSPLRAKVVEPLTMLLAAAGLVLLIACANLGNLLLARATARTREISMRLALGAGRGRLIRQFLTESMVISILGGTVGLAAAWFIRAGLLRMGSDSVVLTATPSPGVLAFAFGLTLLVGVILGLLPSLHIKGATTGGLNRLGRGLTGSAASIRAGKLVVVSQLALSLPLLVGASLLMQTLHNLQGADLGYPKDRLILVEIDAATAGYEPSRAEALFQRLLARIRSVPGVRAATYSHNGLFSGSDSRDQVVVEGYTATGESDRRSRYNHVGPNYFSTLGVPLLLGRDIDERDQASTGKVCVVNEAFAKLFFAGRNPLGMHVTQVYANQRNTFEIVGVARDARENSLRGEIEPRYYVPVAQPIFPQDGVRFAIRTAAEPYTLIADVRSAIVPEDPSLPISVAQPLSDIIAEQLGQERLLARLSLVFGALALLLSALGLYGVLSYGVARRTNEIGIRKALGAQQGAIVAMILGDTGRLLLIGLITGAALSAVGMRLITSRLYGLAPTNPVAFAAGIALLVGVAVVAAGLPAYRASRVDPLVACRHE